MQRLSRRGFIGASVAAGAALSIPLHALTQRAAVQKPRWGVGFGALQPTACATTGLELLALPPDFSYFSYGWSGESMSDGLATPTRHDGMAVVATDGSQLTLVRNHEVISDQGAFGKAAIQYDAAAGGGTTNLIFDIDKSAFVEARATLAGTLANCAGGPTPWGTWLTCEERIADAAQLVETPEGARPTHLTRDHGYVFEVPARGDARPQPLRDLGRFAHEAVAIHEATGAVYLTEDRGAGSGFYRFNPRRSNDLAAGGDLAMLRVAGRDQMVTEVPTGRWFDAEWVVIDDPNRAHDDPAVGDGGGTFAQGQRAGGTRFVRLEGCWADAHRIFFTSTSGGLASCGQVFEFDCENQRLRMIFESPGADVLDNPDNLTVSPRGGILLCEDGSRLGQMLIGLNRTGEVFPFAANAINLIPGQHPLHVGDFRGSEWCGACFSPDGRWLFVNIQTPGVTFAITGPWQEGLI